MVPFFSFTIFEMHEVISSYNLMIGIGIVSGFLLLQRTSKKLQMSKAEDDVLLLILLGSMLIGFISAALFDKIYHYDNIHDFISNLTKYTGMTFAGGLVGGAIAFLAIYCCVNKGFGGIMLNLNCVTPSVIIAHFWGRIGCFLGGCCFGKPTNSILGVHFPDGSFASQLYGNGSRIIPVQLMEAVFLAIIFTCIYFVIIKYSFACYLLLYGIFRFIIENFRGDDRGELFQTILSPSQCISLVMVIIGGIIVIKELLFKWKQVDSISSQI